MKRITLAASAFVAVFAFAFSAHAFQPEISLNYGGKYLNRDSMTVSSTTNSGVEQWTFDTPDGKLRVEVDVKAEEGYPAYRMTSRVRNLSDKETTDVVKDLRVFANNFSIPGDAQVVNIHALLGSRCVPDDFAPVDFTLKQYEEKIFETPSGRSSSEWAPYLEVNANKDHGWLFCVGWTGCWRARFVNNGDNFGVQLGMLRTRFRLLPGESLLQPSVLFFERHNMDRVKFQALVHRYMVNNNSPRDAEGKIQEPIVAVTAGGGNKTPEMMIQVLDYAIKNEWPFDVYWVDAGWYGAPHEDEHYSNCGPNWWKYVGDWRINTTTHPTGDLLPIANAVHKAGKRFLLWFEPERINSEVPIAKQPPFDKQYGLCWYGDSYTLNYMENTIFEIIGKHGIDVYRQDFNMEPTGAWASIELDEGVDRVGVAEAKHVAGLYQFLDDMRAKFPNIMLENCASGGRRVDIEMVKRAHSYCRSDYYIGPKEGDTAFNLGQNMTHNLSAYLPFQGGESNCVPFFDDYGFMSVASSGTVCTPTDLDGAIISREMSAEENAWIKKSLDWAYRLKPYYMGDFYPLTEDTGANDECWCAWSCDLPEKNEGFIIAFRRSKNEQPTQTFALPAIDPNAQYEVEYYDGSKKTVDGKELAELTVTLEASRSFFLALYKKI